MEKPKEPKEPKVEEKEKESSRDIRRAERRARRKEEDAPALLTHAAIGSSQYTNHLPHLSRDEKVIAKAPEDSLRA